MKKILPAITAFVLVAAVAFTACGKKNSEEEKSTTESTTKSTTNLSQNVDEMADDIRTTVDEIKSDISEMMPDGDDDNDMTSASGASTTTKQ